MLYFCIVSGNATIAFWTPSIIKEIGVQGNFTIGLLAAIPFLAGTIAMVWNALRNAGFAVEDGSLEPILDRLAEIDAIGGFPSIESGPPCATSESKTWTGWTPRPAPGSNSALASLE